MDSSDDDEEDSELISRQKTWVMTRMKISKKTHR